MSTTRNDRIVDVTYPVRIRMRLGDIEGGHAIPEVRKDLEDLVIDAAAPHFGADPACFLRPLAERTPDDDGLGSFGVSVGPATVEAQDYVYEARVNLRLGEGSP